MPYYPNDREEDSIRATIDSLLEDGVRKNASDIHIEPTKEETTVRFRIDGLLEPTKAYPTELLPQFISRIKVLSNLDITETRLPQDGRFHLERFGKALDIRVSTYPTMFGECAVLRLLDLSRALVGFTQLGLEEEQQRRMERIIEKPNGLILVTGPTGSGKTTTLFSILNLLNNPRRAIVTLEDPIEYRLPHIRQTQINPDIGVTFARGLRALFRQDADIMMVGEIRDTETARTAVEASLTGHLVLSTFHTNDAIGAIVRLLQMDVEPFLLASALTGIIAQRLVRIICPSCKEPFQPADALLQELNLTNERPEFFRGGGCTTCQHTGYQGRTGIFEIIEVLGEIESMITNRTAPETIKSRIRELGMESLRDHGLKKAKAGITTLEEILRLTKEE